MFNYLFEKLNLKKISEPPYEYDFIMNLCESEYPLYLKKIFKYRLGKNLNLNNPKTYNEKIQWLKLYDSTPLKSMLTDKILVRDWIKNKIGEKYLKPILWQGKSFDDIPFKDLPDSFFIKTNHGCKWHCYIKDKNAFLAEQNVYKYTKMRFDNWMQQSFFGWSDFEFQYKNIIPQLYVEKALLSSPESQPMEIEVYCFDGKPQLFRFLMYKDSSSETLYDGSFNLLSKYMNISVPDITRNKLFNLSRILSEKFKFVRVDWLVHNQTLYFNELTFTPASGLQEFSDKKIEKLLNSYLKLK